MWKGRSRDLALSKGSRKRPVSVGPRALAGVPLCTQVEAAAPGPGGPVGSFQGGAQPGPVKRYPSPRPALPRPPVLPFDSHSFLFLGPSPSPAIERELSEVVELTSPLFPAQWLRGGAPDTQNVELGVKEMQKPFRRGWPALSQAHCLSLGRIPTVSGPECSQLQNRV